MCYIANPLKLCDSLCEKKTFCLLFSETLPVTLQLISPPSLTLYGKRAAKTFCTITLLVFHRQNKTQVWNNTKTINLRSFKKILKGV